MQTPGELKAFGERHGLWDKHIDDKVVIALDTGPPAPIFRDTRRCMSAAWNATVQTRNSSSRWMETVEYGRGSRPCFWVFGVYISEELRTLVYKMLKTGASISELLYYR